MRNRRRRKGGTLPGSVLVLFRSRMPEVPSWPGRASPFGGACTGSTLARAEARIASCAISPMPNRLGSAMDWGIRGMRPGRSGGTISRGVLQHLQQVPAGTHSFEDTMPDNLVLRRRFAQRGGHPQRQDRSGEALGPARKDPARPGQRTRSCCVVSCARGTSAPRGRFVQSLTSDSRFRSMWPTTEEHCLILRGGGNRPCEARQPAMRATKPVDARVRCQLRQSDLRDKGSAIAIAPCSCPGAFLMHPYMSNTRLLFAVPDDHGLLLPPPLHPIIDRGNRSRPDTFRHEG
jgi:hypothetical protein